MSPFVNATNRLGTSLPTTPDGTFTELTDLTNAAPTTGIDDLAQAQPDKSPSGSRGGESSDDKQSVIHNSSLSSSKLPQKLTKAYLDSSRGGFFNFPNNLLRPMREDSFKAATTGGDTPLVNHLGADSRGIPNTSLESPLLEGSSYYIFDSDSTDVAYHLERDSNEDTDATSGFKITRVPMELVPCEGTKDFAYIIHKHEVDGVPSGRKSHETLWPSGSLRDKTASSSACQSKSGIACDSNTKTPPPIGNRGNSKISPAVQARIMAQVSERLRAQRHLKDQLHVVDEEGKHVPGTKNMFLVDDDDIQDVVAIVTDEMRKSRTSSRKRAKWMRPDCADHLGPKVNKAANTIQLPSATPVNPATTINVPRTSYTSFGMSDQQTCTKVRSEDSDAMTTIISHKSIAEITWPHRESHVHHLELFSSTHCSRPVSECSSPKRRDSTGDSSDHPPSEPHGSRGGFLLHHYTTSMSAGEILSDISRKQVSMPDKTDQTTRIISFPPLLPREDTDDGVTPSQTLETAASPTQDTLYRQGVDAHSGSISGQLPEFPEGQVKILRYDHDAFSKNPFTGDFEPEDVTNMAETPPAAPRSRLGVSIGSASHRRRSFQTPGSLKRRESHDGFFPTLMDKIRQGGHKFFHPRHSRRGSREARSPPNLDFPASGSPVRSRDSTVRHLTPQPPRPDATGIYEAMTGTRLVVNRCRNGQCSEDKQPHVCENDYLAPGGPGSPVLVAMHDGNTGR